MPEAGRLALGKRRGPRVAATAQVSSFVARLSPAPGAAAPTAIRRSTGLPIKGRTWTAPIVVNDVPGAAREGMHGLAADGLGVVVLACSDLRQRGARHPHLRYCRFLRATMSSDMVAGTGWSTPRRPGRRVRNAATLPVAVADDGRVAIMFRNHVDGRRDMYVVESRDGATLGTPFGAAIKQGRGSWLLEACPMDGGAVALGGGVTNAVWRREATLYATVTRAAAVVTDAEVELGPGRDPVVARHDQRVDMAWTGPDGIVVRQAGGASTTLGPGGFAEHRGHAGAHAGGVRAPGPRRRPRRDALEARRG